MKRRTLTLDFYLYETASRGLVTGLSHTKDLKLRLVGHNNDRNTFTQGLETTHEHHLEVQILALWIAPLHVDYIFLLAQHLPHHAREAEIEWLATVGQVSMHHLLGKLARAVLMVAGMLHATNARMWPNIVAVVIYRLDIVQRIAKEALDHHRRSVLVDQILHIGGKLVEHWYV